MEKFKEKIRLRVLWMAIITICLSISYIYLSLNSDRLPQIPDFIRGFQFGAFFGVILVLVFFLAKYLGSLRNEEALKKLYIEENDERSIMIMQKTGAFGITICIIGLAFATVIAGFFNEIVFFTLLGATVFTAFVKGGFKLYYHRKL